MKTLYNLAEYKAPETHVEDVAFGADICGSGDVNVGTGDLTDGGNFEW